MNGHSVIQSALRQRLRAHDPRRIRSLVAQTANFTAEEVDVAEELAQETLRQGVRSGYEFVLMDTPQGLQASSVPVKEGRGAGTGMGLLGYACFGRIPCTCSSWDLYWIVVAPQAQGLGVGRLLLEDVEKRVQAAGGERLFAETSSLARYASARQFYVRMGFAQRALFPDFYAPGDAKLVFEKQLFSPAV